MDPTGLTAGGPAASGVATSGLGPDQTQRGRHRPVLLVAALTLLVVAGGLTAFVLANRGSDDDAPTVKEFCTAFGGFQSLGDDSEVTADLSAFVKKAKAAADVLDGVGTPAGMPADARAGLTVLLESIRAFPDDATVEDLSTMIDYDDDEQAKLDALTGYTAKACPDLNP